MERGNLGFHVKGTHKWKNHKANTNGKHRGGRTRSSNEVLVMSMERRGSIVSLLNHSQPAMGGA